MTQNFLLHVCTKKMDVHMVKLTFLIILFVKRSLAIIYYYKFQRTYAASVSFCVSEGGQMLWYGISFVNGVHTCENRNESLIVWTGNPYDKLVYNASCTYRHYGLVPGQGTPGKLNADTCKGYLDNFLCLVGTSEDIVCVWPTGSTVTTNMFTINDELLLSSNTTDADIDGNSSLSTNRNSLENGENSLTVIWVVAIILVLTFGSIIAAVFLYRKKCSGASHQTDNALYTKPEARSDDHCYESPNMQHSTYSNQHSNTESTVAYENVKERPMKTRI